MDVTVNGEARLVPAGTTVDSLVDEIGCGRKGTAVAVNEEVVPRSTWASVEIRPGDRIEVLAAKQGG
jgi:sulfur carrier protein